MAQFKFMGVKNVHTNQKHLICDESSLPCGVYKPYRWRYKPYRWRDAACDDTDIDLQCTACDGTGIGEEVSGGHKKECEKCLGSGLDPVLLEAFEKQDSGESCDAGESGIEGQWLDAEEIHDSKTCTHQLDPEKTIDLCSESTRWKVVTSFRWGRGII